MTTLNVRELVEAGIHFGHRVSRWNPKMAPYIYGKRNMIHIIDLKETIRGLVRARKFLTQLVAEGQDVLLVATKRQAKAIVEREAARSNMPFVTERWLGGTLTNYRTIRERLKYLEHLEALEKSGEINTYSKKMISKLNRERRKISRNLSGIRTMTRLPGAIFVVDPRREYIAVREARRLEIPTVALMDTDSDPDEVDIVVPGNDDSMRAIDIVITQMADAILEGLANRAARPMTAEKMREVAPEGVALRRPRGRKMPGGPRSSGGGGGGGGGRQQGGPPRRRRAKTRADNSAERPQSSPPRAAGETPTTGMPAGPPGPPAETQAAPPQAAEPTPAPEAPKPAAPEAAKPAAPEGPAGGPAT